MLKLIRPLTLLAVTLLLATPGIAAAATIFFDNFNRDNSTDVGNGWIVTEDGRWDVRIKDNRLRMRDKDGDPSVTQITLDTTGYENIRISFDYESFGGDGDTTETSDVLSVLYDDGSGFSLIDAIQLGNDGVVFSVAFLLPAGAAGIPDLASRLALAVSTDDEGVFIDNFRVSADIATAAVSAPEPSAALVFGIGLLTVRARLRRRA